MKLLQSFKRLHKWFALLVGIQLILWIASGIAFSFIDHDKINGNFIFFEQHKKQNKGVPKLADFQALINKYPFAGNIKQFRLFNTNAIKLTSGDKKILLDADSLETMTVDQPLITNIAMASYQGGGDLKSVQRIENPTEETRTFSMPTWQASFNDNYATALYFSADTGEYQGTRTDHWRLNDFFMMLHFMDYGQRGNFNHWLILFAAIILLFFASSGLLLVYSSFSKKDILSLYSHLFFRNVVKLTILDEQGESRTVKVRKNERLVDALAENGIELDTVCGGGGICGGCRIRPLNVKSKEKIESLANHDALTEGELEQGYRLACQLFLEKDICVQLSRGNLWDH